MRAVLTALLILTSTVLMQPTCVHASSLAESAQDISSPPPAPIYEIDPGERPGHIRTPGYWRWNGKRHVWVPSRWIAARDNATWVPDQWEQHGTKWHFAEGHWEASEPAEESDEVTEETQAASTKAVKGKKSPAAKKRASYHNQHIWPRHIGR